jgi:hypothetical protein
MIGMGKHISCLRLCHLDQPQKLSPNDEHHRNYYHFYYNFVGEKDRVPVIGGDGMKLSKARFLVRTGGGSATLTLTRGEKVRR